VRRYLDCVIRHLEFERVHNFRDVGGYATDDGRTVRWGRLYRSDSLSKLQGDDWERYRRLGIRTVIDLRYPVEIAKHGRVAEYEGLEYYNLSIEQHAWDRAAMESTLDPWRFLASQYGQVIHEGVQEIREVLEIIATDAAAGARTVFHCAAGKDRTGITAALVLTLIGVSEHDVVADYALSELATERFIAEWRAADPERPLPWAAYGRAPGVVMELFLAAVKAEFGSVHEYVTDELKLGADVVDALRAGLTA
jgi:protein-tyrosine phosphatase